MRRLVNWLRTSALIQLNMPPTHVRCIGRKKAFFVPLNFFHLNTLVFQNKSMLTTMFIKISYFCWHTNPQGPWTPLNLPSLLVSLSIFPTLFLLRTWCLQQSPWSLCQSVCMIQTFLISLSFPSCVLNFQLALIMKKRASQDPKGASRTVTFTKGPRIKLTKSRFDIKK